MSKEPISITFYDENNVELKTYSQSLMSWGFFKKSTSIEMLDSGIAVENGENITSRFVCDFFENQFSKAELEKHARFNDVIAVSGEIATRLFEIIGEQKEKIPNSQTATK